MFKKILALLLTFVLLFLTGCRGYRASDVMKVVGDTESKDPLRICVDMGTNAPDSMMLADFMNRLKEKAGVGDVVVEVIPPYDDSKGIPNTVERKTVLARLRTEIMAGEGPDVFIMRYTPYWTITKGGLMENDYEGTDCLFKYPEKAMENGLFLPLDDLIENNTELAEWDKLTQSVLEAGRNREGQQIIPLHYTLPLLCYPKTEWEHVPDKKYTWNDMLTNPELLPYSLDLANCGTEGSYVIDGTRTVYWDPYADYIHRILGDLADYENESLRFTEEELLALVNEIMALEHKDAFEKVETAKEVYAGGESLSVNTYNKPMTFLPLYNIKGGITAHIDTFAAVSRTTKRPEEAFKVIDLLMSKNMQREGFLYSRGILIQAGFSLPLHEDLLSESDPLFGSSCYMTDENFEAFCKVREQITAANFNSEITVMLEDMLAECFSRERFKDTESAHLHPQTVEEIVHEAYEHMERRMKE